MRLSLYVDGASKGNPGPASVGAVIEDSRGRVLSEVSRPIGIATNNQAEYKALLRGLEEVDKISNKHPENVALVVKTDSQLLCRQMTGRYRIRNKALIRLSLMVNRKVKQFGSFKIVCIPREQNRRADRLARSAVHREKA